MDTHSLSALLEDEPELLTLPGIVNDLLALIDAPDARVERIVALVAGDAALTARVLRLINSPYYALPVKVDSVQNAITLMGLQNLRDLVIATKVAEKFHDFPGQLVDVHAFWKNSLFAASVARDLYRALGLNRDNLFAVALLHHLGTMVMLQKLPRQMETVLKSAQGNYTDLFEAEQAEFGFTHADVGAELLHSWGMPEIFVEVTRHHHDFYQSLRYATESAIVHLADTMAQQVCPLVNGEGAAMEPDLAVFRYVTLAPDRLDRLYQAVCTRSSDAGVLIGE